MMPSSALLHVVRRGWESTIQLVEEAMGSLGQSLRKMHWIIANMQTVDAPRHKLFTRPIVNKFWKKDACKDAPSSKLLSMPMGDAAYVAEKLIWNFSLLIISMEMELLIVGKSGDTLNKYILILKDEATHKTAIGSCVLTATLRWAHMDIARITLKLCNNILISDQKQMQDVHVQWPSPWGRERPRDSSGLWEISYG
jgi:hypothetical protein